MSSHSFIFLPGRWIGTGKITFTMSPDVLSFHTEWKVEQIDTQVIRCLQKVEVENGGEDMSNAFRFFNITENSFEIELENKIIGKAVGKGIFEKNVIAWEFRRQEDLEGYEVYELMTDNEYRLRAEYLADEEYRTIVEGRIWRVNT